MTARAELAHDGQGKLKDNAVVQVTGLNRRVDR